MARDKTSGKGPPKSRAGGRRPQDAELGDNSPRAFAQYVNSEEIIETFAPPGIDWVEAGKILRKESDEAEAHDLLIKRENAYAEAQNVFSGAFGPPKPTLDAALFTIRQNNLISELKKGNLIATGRRTYSDSRTKIDHNIWKRDFHEWDNTISIYGDVSYNEVKVELPLPEIQIIEPSDSKDRRGPKEKNGIDDVLWVFMVECLERGSPGKKDAALARYQEISKVMGVAPLASLPAFREQIQKRYGQKQWDWLGGGQRAELPAAVIAQPNVNK